MNSAPAEGSQPSMSMTTVPQAHALHKSHPFYQPPGHPIAYFPSLVPMAGSVKAAVLLCQLLYWTPRAKDATGWIYKSQLDLMAETGLSLKEQRQARTELKARQLLEERYERLDHQLWFRVNVEAYNAAILLISNQVPKGHLGKVRKDTSGNTERAHGEMPEGDFAKDLPEITAEIPPETLPEREPNVGNVGTEREKPTRRLRLSARQEELVEILEEQFEDTHSRGAFCRIVSDAGLGEEVAARLLGETLERERAITGPLGAYFIAACQREAQRQGIDLGFKGGRRGAFPPQTWPRPTLLVNSKIHGQAVFPTKFESQRDQVCPSSNTHSHGVGN
jgi:hypothetical protein